MSAEISVGVQQVLRALADLAPSTEQRSGGLTVPTEWFRWLPLLATRLFVSDLPGVFGPGSARSQTQLAVPIERRLGERLAAVDLIRPEERSLRAGWLFVAGRLPIGDGRRRRVLHPLVTVPVRVQQAVGLGRPSLVPAGDVEVTDLVTDAGQRAALEAGIEIGRGALADLSDTAVPSTLLRRLPRLRDFARSVAAAAELPADELVPAQEGPDRLTRTDELVIVAGVAVYAVHGTGGTSRAGSLRTWASQPLTRPTALHALYLDADADGGQTDEADLGDGAGEPGVDSSLPLGPMSTRPSRGVGPRVESPFLLTPVQRAAVARSRNAAVTLISGAAGTGKSHTLAAIACDTLARGETVLVAAKTDATVDALVDLLQRSPGPDPVVFGSNERREALAAQLAGGVLQPVGRATVQAERDRLVAVVARRDQLWRSIADRLAAERLLAVPTDDLWLADPGPTPTTGPAGQPLGAPTQRPGPAQLADGAGAGSPAPTERSTAPATAPAHFGGPAASGPAASTELSAARAAAAEHIDGPTALGPAATTELAAARAIAPGLFDGPPAIRPSGPSGLPNQASRAGQAGQADPAGPSDPIGLAELEELIETAMAPARGWWSRRRRRKALRKAIGRAGAPPGTSIAALAGALEVARIVRGPAGAAVIAGLEIGDDWEELQRLDDEARRLRARWLAAESRSERRLNRRTLPAVAVLATALRSGRAARRAQLERLDDRLTTALPLWVGTLPDIDDLLPPVAGLFDLVILDEGSSIDQPLAAPALLRGKRAVVAGDPRQLRHVSFVGDDQMAKVAGDHGLDAAPVLAARLDVRRNSVFDVAAGVAAVLTLDEHFRSNPHLMDFVSRRLYGGSVKLATRSPATESRRCVSVVRLDGARDRNGVVEAEVSQVVRLLRKLREEGTTSVGVVTPFRAQADALEQAVLEDLAAADLQALDLRVGTVHGFQGNERDIVVVSLGVGAEASAATWRFVEDPHLFTVLATRARRRLILLASGEPPAGGLLAEYLAQADAPPGRPEPAGPVSAWAKALADDLAAAGLTITTGYPTGRHVVDVAFGDWTRSLALECDLHPHGPGAHIDRHLALVRAGWDIIEAHRSKWSDNPTTLVVDLTSTYARPSA